MAFENPIVDGPPRQTGPDRKFCTDCGTNIFRRAEICPSCGCRQLQPPQNAYANARSSNISVGMLASLLIMNFLWSGWGNVSIGDERGRQYAKINVLFFILSLFSAYIPCVIFCCFCTYQGYQFLEQREAAADV